MNSVVLQAEGLVKSYRNGAASTTVLKGVNLTVGRGETVAVVGPSGAGKTTLLYLLGGLARPSAGRVTVSGRDLSALRDEEISKLRNQKIGFVFQFHHLLPELNALENVALPILVSGGSRTAARQTARQLLGEVGLFHRIEHKPGELSGGEQQRVAIARALATQPDVILADEPTGNLDQNTASSVHEALFQSSRAREQALVLVTHNESLASQTGRRIEMQDGRIVRQG